MTSLREPMLFDHYVAFDPSLWWNKGVLVDSALALLSAEPKVAFEMPEQPHIVNFGSVR